MAWNMRSKDFITVKINDMVYS